MVLFIFSILAFAVAILGIIVFTKTSDRNIKSTTLGITAASGVFGLIFLIFASTTIISTRNVGVVVSFGKAETTLENGFHFKKPWANVIEYNGTIQTIEETNNQDGDNRIKVNLANGAPAWVSLKAQWQVEGSEVQELYANYRTFNDVSDRFVARVIEQSTLNVFSGFNPIDAFKADSEGTQVFDYVTLQNKIVAESNKQFENRVKIINLTLTPEFDEATTQRIQSISSEIANTRIAEQEALTAAARVDAYNTINSAIAANPLVLVDKCLNALQPGQSPEGCWPYGEVQMTLPVR